MRALIARAVAHFSYTPLLGLAAAISFVRLVVYAVLLEIAQFGTLSKMLLVSTLFGMVGSLGLQSVASRDLPALLARGRARRGLRLLGHTVAVAGWVAALGLLAAVCGLPLFDLTASELVLGILHGFAQQAFLTVTFESRSRLEMMRYARDMAVRNVTIAAVGAGVAVAGGGADAVALAEIAGTVALCVIVAREALRRAHTSAALLVHAWAVHGAGLPWRSALTMAAGAMVMFASSNLDRWLAAEMLSRDAFAVYAFGWLALTAAQSVQALLNAGLLPLLARRRAEAFEAGAYRLTRLTSCTLLAAGLIVAAPLAWTLAVLVERWMPQYAEAKPLWLPLLLAAAFRVSDFWSSLLPVAGRETDLLFAQMAVVAAAGIGYLAWWAAGSGGPTPVSLAWLAAVTALLSHAVSALVAGQLRRAPARAS